MKKVLLTFLEAGRAMIETLFYTLLFTYLGLFVIETLVPMSVSSFFSLRWLLVVTVVSGVVFQILVYHQQRRKT